MDEVLYLESDEEITSVIEKLKHADGSSIALVLPKSAQLVQSAVNIKLLKREAERLKKRISIITQDSIGIHLATQVGIPVFAAVGDESPIRPVANPKPNIDDVVELDEPRAEEALSEDSPVPVKRYDVGATTQDTPAQTAISDPISNRVQLQQVSEKRSPKRIRTIIAFLAFLIIATGGWLFFIYPRATVVLGVATSPVHEVIEVIVDNNIEKADENTAHIPGQKLQSEKSVKDIYDSTGSKEVGTKASGTVTVTNRLGETLTLSMGTQFTRGEVVVRSSAAVTVPAATATIDSRGNIAVSAGTVDVKVEAAESGDAGNLVSGQFAISSLPTAKQDKVTAANASALAGGTSRKVKVLTEDDVARAKGASAEKAKLELVSQLKEKAGDQLFLDGAVEIEVIDPAVSKNVGDETDNFELSATVRARTITLSTDSYRAMVTALTERRIGEGKELLLNSSDAIQTAVMRTGYGDGILVLSATVQAESAQRFNEDAMKHLIAGKGVLEAEGLLKTQDGVKSARVTVRPSFRHSIPKAVSQIQFTFTRE